MKSSSSSLSLLGCTLVGLPRCENLFIHRSDCLSRSCHRCQVFFHTPTSIGRSAELNPTQWSTPIKHTFLGASSLQEPRHAIERKEDDSSLKGRVLKVGLALPAKCRSLSQDLNSIKPTLWEQCQDPNPIRLLTWAGCQDCMLIKGTRHQHLHPKPTRDTWEECQDPNPISLLTWAGCQDCMLIKDTRHQLLHPKPTRDTWEECQDLNPIRLLTWAGCQDCMLIKDTRHQPLHLGLTRDT